jgi:hypothetical protein
MRIISHNKLVDINYDNVMIELEISQCGTGGQISIRYPEFKVLGSYTKERALEVMDEINATNTSLEIWKIRSSNMSDEELTKVGCPHLLKLMEYSTFYMPKE